MAGKPKGLPKTGGRKKGSLNKNTTKVKDALLSVYNDIGGDESFAEWARRERTEFYKLFAKLLPQEINHGGQEDNPIKQDIKVTFIEPENTDSV